MTFLDLIIFLAKSNNFLLLDRDKKTPVITVQS